MMAKTYVEVCEATIARQKKELVQMKNLVEDYKGLCEILLSVALTADQHKELRKRLKLLEEE